MLPFPMLFDLQKQHVRGNPVYYDADAKVYRYVADGALAAGFSGGDERPCVKCGLTAEHEGPDPCLGMIPGVVSACCGHGVNAPYSFHEGQEVGGFQPPPEV